MHSPLRLAAAEKRLRLLYLSSANYQRLDNRTTGSRRLGWACDSGTLNRMLRTYVCSGGLIFILYLGIQHIFLVRSL